LIQVNPQIHATNAWNPTGRNLEPVPGTRLYYAHAETLGGPRTFVLLGDQQHLTFVGDPSNSMVVQWGTDLPTLTSKVTVRDSGFGYQGRIAIGAVELQQVSADTLFELLNARCKLTIGEVLVAVVHGLELATVNGHHRIAK